MSRLYIIKLLLSAALISPSALMPLYAQETKTEEKKVTEISSIWKKLVKESLAGIHFIDSEGDPVKISLKESIEEEDNYQTINFSELLNNYEILEAYIENEDEKLAIEPILFIQDETVYAIEKTEEELDLEELPEQAIAVEEENLYFVLNKLEEEGTVAAFDLIEKAIEKTAIPEAKLMKEGVPVLNEELLYKLEEVELKENGLKFKTGEEAGFDKYDYVAETDEFDPLTEKSLLPTMKFTFEGDRVLSLNDWTLSEQNQDGDPTYVYSLAVDGGIQSVKKGGFQIAVFANANNTPIATIAAGDANPQIITEDVEDPPYTTVNLFDYWITPSQKDNDSTLWNDLVKLWKEKNNKDVSSPYQVGINEGHYLLFGGNGPSGTDYGLGQGIEGYSAFDWSNKGLKLTMLGGHNSWTGNVRDQHPDGGEFGGPYVGIVANQLENGFPKISEKIVNKPGSDYTTFVENEDRQSESLSYLFDPNEPNNFKESYPDVSGLFRKDENGYFYYTSLEKTTFGTDEDKNKKEVNGAFAELNQEGDKNRITLYDYVLPDMSKSSDDFRFKGQYFPLSQQGSGQKSYADLLKMEDELHKINNEGSSTYNTNTRDSSRSPYLNHFFGTTISTMFQQPVNGRIGENNLPVTFEFSGDDDVWIFIDGVLVADLGGVHTPDSVRINFADGSIKVYDTVFEENDYTINQAGAKQVFDENGVPTKVAYTIKDAFEKAGKDTSQQWNGNTFADNSIHTLNFYYLERGHDMSNMSIRFNMPEPEAHQIYKVDDQGEPLSGVSFNLYSAKENVDLSGVPYPTVKQFDRNKELIATITTDENGIGKFMDADKKRPLDFVKLTNEYQSNYFILEEFKTPKGYRSGKDIVLEYTNRPKQENVDSFKVVNKYETGAYASFVAEWKQDLKPDRFSANPVYYAKFNADTGEIEKDNSQDPFKPDKLEKGLSLVIPVIKAQNTLNGTSDIWMPLYGSNKAGWNTVKVEWEDTSIDKDKVFLQTLFKAALLQISDNDLRDWYLKWNQNSGGTSDALASLERLEGRIEDLPGEPGRYKNINPNGDLNLLTLFIPEEILKSDPINLSDEYSDDDQRYLALQQKLKDLIDTYTPEAEVPDDETEVPEDETEILDKAIKDLLSKLEMDKLGLVYTNSFERTYTTIIYVPNEQRELRVKKVDEAGNPVAGAYFALFESAKAANKFNVITEEEDLTNLSVPSEGIVSLGKTADGPSNPSEDGSSDIPEGMLIFKQTTEERDGIAQTNWPVKKENGNNVYWLKEIYIPEDKGLTINNSLIKIVVEDEAIYADATGYQMVMVKDEDGELKEELKPVTNSNLDGSKDGVKVEAGLGQLAQTLTKYAIGNNVDSTLHNITIYEEEAGSESDPLQWSENSESDPYDLHYGNFTDYLSSQYGPISDGLDEPAVFTAEEGFIRAMPKQTQNVSDDPHDRTGKIDQLTDTGNAEGQPIDLNGLFTLTNVVVVTNERVSSLEITKTVDKSSGVEPDKSDKYVFNITLTSRFPLANEYHAYILNKDDKKNVEHRSEDCNDLVLQGPTTESGVYTYEAQVILEHGQTYYIKGLPLNTGFTVRETIELEGSERSYSYKTSSKKDSDKDFTDSLEVEGNTNSKADKNNNIVPPVQVEFINKVEENLVFVELPETGGSTPWGIVLGGSIILILGAAGIVVVESRKRKL